jgi:DNA-binding NtrC family response regulator
MKADRTKLVIVDDDEKILFAFERVFRKEGYETVTARDGEEALGRISSVRAGCRDHGHHHAGLGRSGDPSQDQI